MKKILTSILLVTASLLIVAQEKADTALSFKSFDDEVGLDVQRETGAVKILLYVKDITQFHHIIIERSAENANYFAKCRYILCSNAKVKDGLLTEYDRYPYSATKDVYYRIKTVTNDGVERSYPPVLLPATKQ